MMRDRYVYCIDDEDGVPVYIGVGKRDRLNSHIQEAKVGRGPRRKVNFEKYEYFVACLQRGYEPKPYKIAEHLTPHEALEFERFLVAWYGRRDLGTGSLLNRNNGGYGSRNPSASTRAKLAAAVAGKPRHPEIRKRISDSMKAILATEAGRAERSRQLKIRWESAAARKKQSDIRREHIAVEGGSEEMTRRCRVRWDNPLAKAAQQERLAKMWAEPGRRERYAQKMREYWARKKLTSEVGAPA
jgi:hypothetical protein